MPDTQKWDNEKILVVTSSEAFEERLINILEGGAWSYLKTSTPEEALENIDEGGIALVFLDTFLPRTNGFDLCRRIKSTPNGANIPVYLFGGSVVDDKGEVIRLWGCEDFLPKSIDDNTIIEILNKVIPPVDVTSWSMEEPAPQKEPAPLKEAEPWPSLEESTPMEEPAATEEPTPLKEAEPWPSLEESTPMEEPAATEKPAPLKEAEPWPSLEGSTSLEESEPKEEPAPLKEFVPPTTAKESVPMPSMRGRLEEKSILDLFYELHIREWSGTLTLDRGGVEKAVYFDKGQPTLAITSHEGDKLGEWLVKIGRISEIELKDALEIAGHEGKRLGTVLVNLSILAPEEIRSLVQRHMEEIIFSIFEWEDGAYMLSDMNISRGEEILLEKSAANVIMDGVRRRYTLTRIKGVLGPPERIYQFSPHSAITIRDIRLSPSELKVVDLIDGKTNLAGIISSSSLTPLDTSRVLFSLLSLKIIEEIRKEEAPETKPAPMLPLDEVYGLDPVALLELDRKALSPHAIAFLKHVDGRRTLIQAIEESRLEKNKAMEGLWELYERGLLKPVVSATKPQIESIPMETALMESAAMDIAPIKTASTEAAPIEVAPISPPSDVLAPASTPETVIEESPPEVPMPEEPLLMGEEPVVYEVPAEQPQGYDFKRIMIIALPSLFVATVLIGGAIYFLKKSPVREPRHSVSAALPTAGVKATEAALPLSEVTQSRPVPQPIAAQVPVPAPQSSAPASIAVKRPEEADPVVKPKKVAAEKPKSATERKIDRLRKALERNPDSIDALLDLGMAILELGEPVDAFLHIKKAASLSPDSPRAHFAMGMAYKALGNKNKALVEFQEVIRLDKTGPFSDRSMTQILELKK